MSTEHNCPFLNNDEIVVEVLRLRSMDRKRKEICEAAEQESRRISFICTTSSQKLTEIREAFLDGKLSGIPNELQKLIDTLSKC